MNICIFRLRYLEFIHPFIPAAFRHEASQYPHLCSRGYWNFFTSYLGANSLGPFSLTTVSQQEERPIRQILYLGNLLETCHFQSFWV